MTIFKVGKDEHVVSVTRLKDEGEDEGEEEGEIEGGGAPEPTEGESE